MLNYVVRGGKFFIGSIEAVKMFQQGFCTRFREEKVIKNHISEPLMSKAQVAQLGQAAFVEYLDKQLIWQYVKASQRPKVLQCHIEAKR